MNHKQALEAPAVRRRKATTRRDATTPFPREIVTSAPGRICLFGEHQDYLALPVIAMAIDLRVTVAGVRRSDCILNVNLPDIGKQFSYDPNVQFAYRHDRDYLPAASNVLGRLSVRWPVGYDVEVRGDIPVNSGTSSSSALQVAWTAFLLAAAGDPRATDPGFVAIQAQRSEVPEFGSPGGMMDHYSTAFGGVVWLDCKDPISVERLPENIGPFVLIDSGQPKDTNGVLGRARAGAEQALRETARVATEGPVSWETLDNANRPRLDDKSLDRVMSAVLRNRDLTDEARRAFKSAAPATEIGRLLAAHQRELAGGLELSTPLIDDLLTRASQMGALGGKINGSGGGGSLFVLSPDKAPSIADEFEKAGHRAWVVNCGQGLQVATKP